MSPRKILIPGTAVVVARWVFTLFGAVHVGIRDFQ